MPSFANIKSFTSNFDTILQLTAGLSRASVKAPMQGPRSHFTLAAIVLLGLLAASYHVFSGAGLYDEGFANVAAMRIGFGEFPYKDFWTVYAPGNALLLHGAHLLFGETLLVSRLLDVAILFSLFCCLLWQLHRTVRTGIVWWSGAAGLLVITGQMSATHSYAMWPALLCAAASLAALGLVFEKNRAPGWRALCVPGIGVVATSLFRHDVAVYLFVSLTFGLLLADLLRARHRSPPLASALRFSLIVGVSGMAAWTLIAFEAGIKPLVEQLIHDPAVILQRYRKLPIALSYPPSLTSLAWSYFPAILAITGILAWHASRRARRQGHHLSASPLVRLPSWLCTGVFGSLLLLQLFSRADDVHAEPAFLFLFIAIIMGVDWLARAARHEDDLSTASLVLTLAAVLGAAIPLSYDIRYHGFKLPRWQCSTQVKRAPCIPLQDDQAAMLVKVAGLPSPRMPLFVANTDNNRIMINDVMFYFLVGRPIPVKWHEMHPGIATESRAQRDMAAMLDARHPDYIVLVAMPAPSEHNASRLAGTGIELDRYIADHYALEDRIGHYRLLARRDKASMKTAHASGARLAPAAPGRAM